jgi:cytochrome c biogenesis protein ResB
MWLRKTENFIIGTIDMNRPLRYDTVWMLLGLVDPKNHEFAKGVFISNDKRSSGAFKCKKDHLQPPGTVCFKFETTYAADYRHSFHECFNDSNIRILSKPDQNAYQHEFVLQEELSSFSSNEKTIKVAGEIPEIIYSRHGKLETLSPDWLTTSLSNLELLGGASRKNNNVIRFS